MRYIYKTPSSGARDYANFDKRNKYYWERRQPINPANEERTFYELIEGYFVPDF